VEPSTDQPALPTQLGRYRLDRSAATLGATGVVVRAEEIGSGRTVAVKVPNELAPGARTRARFAREARIAREAGSPYVMEVLDRGVAGELPYLVMEWVPQTVSGVIEDRARLDERVSLRILLQTAEALARLHERGIVHRDVSPRNVGLTDQLEVRLLDFGIAASAAESGGASTAALGTPAFSAPERLDESRHDDDPRIDLYSLGCIGFLLLSGVSAYSGSRSEVLRQHRTGARPDLALAPARLRPMLERLLAVAPDERYQSAEALIEDLRALLGMSSTTRPAVGRRDQRSAVAVGLVPVFGLGLAAVIALLVLTRGGEAESPVAGPEPTAAAIVAVVPTVVPAPPGPIAGWGTVSTEAAHDGDVMLARTERHLYIAQSGHDDTDGSVAVWKAEVFGNGVVGPILEQQHLNTGADGFPAVFAISGMAIWGDCLYVVPGETNADPLIETQVIERARIDPATGDLSPFEVDEQPLLRRRAQAALIAAEGHLYAIGGFGFTRSPDRATVEFAQIGDDCALSPWQITAELMVPTAEPRVATHEGHLYVVGGHEGDTGAAPVATVQRAAVMPGGALTPWIALEDERLITPRFDHGVAAVDGWLVAAGGQIQTIGSSPSIQTNLVEYARINEDGSLSPWTAAPELPTPRAGLAMVDLGGHLLAIGGEEGRTSEVRLVAERGLSSNLAIAAPPDSGAEVVDPSAPLIVDIGCSPLVIETGGTIACTPETSGTVRGVDWSTTAGRFAERAIEFRIWEPLTHLVSLEVCNTAGCNYADAAVIVAADWHFWQQDFLNHPDTLPAAGGGLRVNTVAGTLDDEIAADVVFTVRGPDFEEEIIGELCAAAPHPWGWSVCYDALFEIPPNSVGTVQTYTIEASAPTLEGVLNSSFAVAEE